MHRRHASVLRSVCAGGCLCVFAVCDLFFPVISSDAVNTFKKLENHWDAKVALLHSADRQHAVALALARINYLAKKQNGSVCKMLEIFFIISWSTMTHKSMYRMNR